MVNWKKTMMGAASGGEEGWMLTLTDTSNLTDNAPQANRGVNDNLAGSLAGVTSGGDVVMNVWNTDNNTRFYNYVFRFDSEGSVVAAKRYGDNSSAATSSYKMNGSVIITDNDDIFVAGRPYDSSVGGSKYFVFSLNSDLSINYYYDAPLYSDGWKNLSGYQVVPSDDLAYCTQGSGVVYNGLNTTSSSTRTQRTSQLFDDTKSFNSRPIATANVSYRIGEQSQTRYVGRYSGTYKNTNAWRTYINPTQSTGSQHIVWSEYYQGASTSSTYDAYCGFEVFNDRISSTKENPAIFKLNYSDGAVSQAKSFALNTSPYSLYGCTIAGVGTSPTGDVYIIMQYDTVNPDEFVLLHLDSDLSLQKALRFEFNGSYWRIGYNGKGITTIDFNPDGSFLYFTGFFYTNQLVSGTYSYVRAVGLVKYPTDLSYEDPIVFPGSYSPYQQNAFTITDVTSTISYGNFTAYSTGASGASNLPLYTGNATTTGTDTFSEADWTGLYDLDRDQAPLTG